MKLNIPSTSINEIANLTVILLNNNWISRNWISEMSCSRKFFFFSLFLMPILLLGQNSRYFDSSKFLRAKKILIIAPHPDDEILGFAGIIYGARAMGKEVKVVIITNGDGYGSACYFWKNGIPKEDTLFKGRGCSPEELENYGTTRISESRKALKILGIDSSDVIRLGYPDGYLGEMLRFPDSVFTGNTSRHLSYANQPFSGVNLKRELKNIFLSEPDEEVYTVHIKDSHDDHAAVAGFIQDVRTDLIKNEILFPVYWTVIHEPAGDNNIWPLPVCNWDFLKGRMMVQREARYTPWQTLQPPLSMKEQPYFYFIPEALWIEKPDHNSLMREALDQYQTGIGEVKNDGTPVDDKYAGWMDRNGYLLSFVKRNHLFWEAPLPDISKHRMGSCREVLSIYPLDTIVLGISALTMEGNCLCQSEMFPGKGVIIGSGVEAGRVVFEFGPVFRDSITVIINWSDNSWRSDQKLLEVYNQGTSQWETIGSFSGNDGKIHTDRFKLSVHHELPGTLHQVKIGFSGSKNARVHLECIEVKEIF
jgi:LmbE family N-acetylglucosaminyl deacetylase